MLNDDTFLSRFDNFGNVFCKRIIAIIDTKMENLKMNNNRLV